MLWYYAFQLFRGLLKKMKENVGGTSGLKKNYTVNPWGPRGEKKTPVSSDFQIIYVNELHYLRFHRDLVSKLNFSSWQLYPWLPFLSWETWTKESSIVSAGEPSVWLICAAEDKLCSQSTQWSHMFTSYSMFSGKWMKSSLKAVKGLLFTSLIRNNCILVLYCPKHCMWLQRFICICSLCANELFPSYNTKQKTGTFPQFIYFARKRETCGT